MMYLCIVYHGTEGPVVVDDMASTLLADKFILAGQELGFDHVDVTAQKQFGEKWFIIPVNKSLSVVVNCFNSRQISGLCFSFLTLLGLF